LDELAHGRLRHGTTARLGTRRVDDGAPWFAADDLGGLRELLLGRTGASSPG
jgi:hypothetical protein